MWQLVATPPLSLVEVQREAACQAHFYVLRKGEVAYISQSLPAILKK